MFSRHVAVLHASRALALFLLASPSFAQTGNKPDDDPMIRFKESIKVEAQKEPEDKQKIPVSVTAVPDYSLKAMGVRIPSDAAILAPNTFYNEFTARKLSNATFRGIGSSPANPGVTTYIDGVPQLNTNSSSFELLDVQQIEFVRGPQGGLFGRNTLGGLVNVASKMPSRAGWTGSFSVPFGNFSEWAIRGDASGPVSDKFSVGFSFAQAERDGYTVNDVTGNDVDSRDAFSARGQAVWTPNAQWESRFIFSGERARDGDYALNDLAAVKSDPFHVQRDFEGHTDRDIFNTTIQVRRNGPISMTSTTGFVNWDTSDVTDLDYSIFPAVVRDNHEEDTQFTQEVRFASAEDRRLKLSNSTSLRWQGGVFLFTQGYEQDAVNNFGAGFVATFPVSRHSPRADLDDFGISFYGQGTATMNDRIDFTVGGRFDYEDKSAHIETFFDPVVAPGTSLDDDRSFSNFSPQFSVGYRMDADKMIYGTVTRGFKAGGFNPVSLPGFESYDEEQAWHFEAGAKTSWADNLLHLNLAFFHIDWSDLQLNTPIPFAIGEFYIANAGDATSTGFELEVGAMPVPGLELFSSFGYTNAEFGDNSVSDGVSVDGNKLFNTPDMTFSAGVQLSHPINSNLNAFGRFDVVSYGDFFYDNQNTTGQDAYALANIRAGVRAKLVTVEFWMRNAFDTEYIPVALPFLSQSGFIAEPGAPRTFGLSAGVRF